MICFVRSVPEFISFETATASIFSEFLSSYFLFVTEKHVNLLQNGLKV